MLLIGSRTGGPLIPLLGIKDDLQQVRPDLRFGIIGVRGGFEDQVARTERLAIDYLPEVKTPTRPGGLRGVLFLLLLPVHMLGLALRLVLSSFLAWQILRRTSPKLILSMSNFVSVPVIWANRLRGRRRARVALHQLDIENRTVVLTRPFVDLLSAGLEEICAAGRSRFVPNPVRYARFDALDPAEARLLLEEAGLVSGSEERPILLVFGGGSGSEFINNWVARNEQDLRRMFFVLHLTGYLQEQRHHARTEQWICVREGLTDLMPAALIAADVVLARAGMSTVSELIYLKKNAYLVPIPQSHQVTNANAVSRFFRILEQRDVSDWVATLGHDLAQSFPQFRAVRWDYYAQEKREAYRDNLLSLAGL